MTNHRLTTLERAFEIARGGTASSVEDVRRTLRAERFDQVDQHLAGMTVKRQLIAAITARKREQLANVD